MAHSSSLFHFSPILQERIWGEFHACFEVKNVLRKPFISVGVRAGARLYSQCFTVCSVETRDIGGIKRGPGTLLLFSVFSWLGYNGTCHSACRLSRAKGFSKLFTLVWDYILNSPWWCNMQCWREVPLRTSAVPQEMHRASWHIWNQI